MFPGLPPSRWSWSFHEGGRSISMACVRIEGVIAMGVGSRDFAQNRRRGHRNGTHLDRCSHPVALNN